MRGAAVTGVLTALLVAAGCTADDADRSVATQAAPTTDDPATDDSATSDTATSAPAVPVDLGALDGPLREQTQWVLDQLAPGASGPTAEEAQERFHPDFLDQVPAGQLASVFATLRGESPVVVADVGEAQEHPEGPRSTQLTLVGETNLQMSITVDGDGLIAGLLFQPGPATDLPEVGSWEELEEEFAALGGTTRVVVGEVADGACTTTYSSEGADQPAPSGSVFKLLVLSAVVDAVAAGDLAWDQELTLTPGLKSLPSGELQDRPDGSAVTVREAATLMISISDNTGTDLLMDAVGPDRLRDAVERVTDDPDRLTPLPTTRQFFLLGWDAPELREQWADADPAGREQLLAQLPDDLARLRGNPFSVTQPAWPDGVDWFLTGEEICTAHAVLQEQAGSEPGEPVRQILSANPGLPSPDGATYQGFKGGSAPGVLAYTFYLEGEGDGHGAGRVLSVQVAHEGQILPTGFTDLTQAGLALLVRD